MVKSSAQGLLTTLDDLFSTQEEREIAAQPRVQDISIDLIDEFPNHPFKVRIDESMMEMAESVKQHGILVPAIMRPKENGRYEMVAGHRRMTACMIAEKEEIPCIVRDLTDEEATIIMVDANIQREELLPSERAFAYKMKMEAMKRQGNRRDLTSDQNGPKLAANYIGQESGVSGSQVKRFIRLTELIPELLDMVDEKRLGFTIAVDISYISQEVQKWLYEYIKDNGVIKSEQIAKLREHLENNTINQVEMIQLLNGSLKGRYPSKKVTLSEKKLYKYFPSNYSSSDMEGVILTLLEEWKHRQVGE